MLAFVIIFSPKCTPSKPKPLVKPVEPLKEIEKPGQFQMDVVNHH